MKEKNCGIYCIINQINGKVYTGRSKNLKHRIRSHFIRLLFNEHKNKSLQQEFNIYGKENFTHNIIKYCREKYLTKWEQYYIDSYQACNPYCGYNESLKSDKIGFTEEIRKRMSLSAIGNKNSSGKRKKPIKKGNHKRTSPEIISIMVLNREKGLSFRAIANKLNINNIPTRRGGKWKPGTIKYLLDNK